jgi:hypothetical protein
VRRIIATAYVRADHIGEIFRRQRHRQHDRLTGTTNEPFPRMSMADFAHYPITSGTRPGEEHESLHGRLEKHADH